MTPEQKFARWVRVSIASFLLMFVYFIVADIWIPLTPDSTVMRVVTPVSARVSGYVAAVHVHNNSQVKKGDLLFELDATPFRNSCALTSRFLILILITIIVMAYYERAPHE